MNLSEAIATCRADLSVLDEKGIRYEPGWEPKVYISDDPNKGVSYKMAYDALPTLSTEANSAIPAFMVTIVDPETYEILFAPIKVAEALGGEVQRGSWTTVAAMFPVVEATGEVSSYDDYSNSGVSGMNMNFPQRQPYLFQTVINYGELEVARASEARVNIVAEKEKAAASNLNRFANYTYAFGVQGLENYGTTNNPNLPASLTPALKAYGGTAWFYQGVVRATANKMFTDIQSIVSQLITQGNGQIDTQNSDDRGVLGDGRQRADHDQRLQRLRLRSAQEELPEPQAGLGRAAVRCEDALEQPGPGRREPVPDHRGAGRGTAHRHVCVQREDAGAPDRA